MAIIERVEAVAGEKRKIKITNPATLEALYDIECQTEEEVNLAVTKARVAQPAWAGLPLEQRIAYMKRLRDVILERQDDIIQTVIRETGKPMQDALMMEVYGVAQQITYWCNQAPKTLVPETIRPPGIMKLMKKIRMVYKPLGVVGIIAPWNGPFILTAAYTIQAMLAGNTVVAKGSEITPYSSKILEDLCREAGIPDGVVQVLIGDGETGAALCRADINKMSFTGSVTTGKKVAAACLEKLIPCTLELGGKDAMIVCADADLDKAAHGAVWGGCMNTGHFCCGIERIYVEAPVYDEFVKKVQGLTQSLRQGQGHGVNEDVGAVFWDRQMLVMESHVNDAVAAGAKVLVGGERDKSKGGLYFKPTVMVDVDEESDLMTKETFGPIMPIVKVNTIDEAIQKANHSNYGLHGSVWTKNQEKGIAIAEKIETGSMSVNDIGMVAGLPSAPFAGVKESGLGSVNGMNALRAYTHPMPIILGDYRGADTGYPHDQKKFDQMKQAMNFMWNSTIGRLFFD